jgi:hypothetical protein
MEATLSPQPVETGFTPTARAERPPFADAISIREATLADSPAIEALATLDSSRRPHGRVLVAEVEGGIVAALPVDGHRAIADPFRRTSELVALLEMRAAQLR